MSSDVEDLVRAGYAAFNEGGVEPLLKFWHSDGVFVNSREDPDPGIHRGIDAIRKQALRWIETYPDLQMEPLEIRTNGDRAFVWVRLSGHGAGSGVPIDMEGAHIWTVEKGKCRRIEEYLDRAEGLEVAGLSEQQARADSS